MFELFIVDLGQGLQGVVNILDVVHVEDLHHAGGALVHWVPLSVEDSGLLHLLGAELWLEADPVEPRALAESDLGNLLHLAVIELSEESLFD